MPTEVKKAPALTFDRATLATLLTKIDPGLTTAQLDALLQAAGKSETEAVKALLGQINKLVLGGSADIDESDLSGVLAGLESSGKSGKIVSLAGNDSAKLAAMAQTDIGARYAIIQGLPFAITGNDALYDALNRDGSLHKFDPNTGEKRFTDEWFKDRAQFLAVKFKLEGAGKIGVDGTQSWVFEEHNAGGVTRLEVNATQATKGAAKMIFASATSQTQTLVGSANGDRIYSGGGDDLINAGAGDDYVEGGQGGDMIDGGRGNDTLRGGQGDDQIDGNAGDDKLYGDAGADYLVGGKGQDRMEGGSGFDTYEIDTGDGNDTLLDADGLGEIILDGQALTGAGSYKDGQYQSQDGRVSYSFAGDLVEGGVLTIVVNGTANADGTPGTGTNTLRVVNFKDGDLGIKLNPQAVDGETPEPTGITGQSYRRIPLSPSYTDTQSELDLNPRPDMSQGRAAAVASHPTQPNADTGAAAIGNVASDNSSNSSNPSTTWLEHDASYAQLFADPIADVSFVTGEHVSLAQAEYAKLGKPAPQAANDDHFANLAPHTGAFAPEFALAMGIDPALVPGGFEAAALHPRNIESALLEFHNTTTPDGGLGGENLGGMEQLSLGNLAIGTGKLELSDAKYSDLANQKIGVKA